MAQGRPSAEEKVTPSRGGVGRGDTIVAPATPAGESAVSVVRLSGPDAVRIARELTGAALEPRRAAAALASDGEPLDRVVVTWFAAPKSYTGEDVVELSGHGSPYARTRLLAACVRAGARPAEPGEFTLRAYLNGKLDLAQAEAVAQLIRARTAWAHRAALASLEGGWSERVSAARERLLGLLARVEASIDHPDEDVPLLPPAEGAAEAGALAAELSGWLARSPAVRVVEDGLRVCILGAPNAGKSSLLNALLGRDRAIVLDEPGTTRDVLEERLELGGAPVVLVDTAGLREGKLDAAEAVGIERAKKAALAADLCLLVRDASRAPNADDAQAEAVARESDKPFLLVLNKCDLLAVPSPACGRGSRPEGPEGEVSLFVSTKTGEGLEALCSAIARRAGQAPPHDEAVAVTARQRAALETAARALEKAREVWSLSGADELAAVHAREALEALGAIVGGSGSEDVLTEIFSRFCIGK